MAQDYKKQAAGYHGIQNAKYSVRTTDGAPGTQINPFAYAKAVSLEPSLETEAIYANNSAIFSAVSDQGYKGNFGTTAQDRGFEEAVGMLLPLDGGTADINLISLKRFDFYYEYSEKTSGGHSYVVKVWLLGCEASKAAKSHETDTTKATFGEYSYPLTIFGDKVRASDGTAIYRDASGNELTATRIIAVPTDTGYASFGDTVPVPKVTAVSGGET